MLTTDEFSAGALSAARPISILRPLAEHEREVLVAGASEAPVAVILEDGYAYDWFETTQSENWTGLIIPNLQVELDEASAFDARLERSPFGAAVRAGTELTICVKGHNGRGTTFITLEAGLPPIEDYKVGFKRWQLALGNSETKRIVRKFDLATPPYPYQ